MKIAGEVQNTLLLMVVGGAAAYMIYRKSGQVVSDVADTVADVAKTKLNPVSDQNFAYQWSGDFVGMFTGKDSTLGSQLYDGTEAVTDWVENGTLSPWRAASDANVFITGGEDRTNVFNRLANEVTSKIVGRDETLGGAIYEAQQGVENFFRELF